MIGLTDIVKAIEQRQPVVNKCDVMQHTAWISRVSDLANATHECISFVSQTRYLADLTNTQAGVVLVSACFANQLPKLPSSVVVLVADAYLAYACVSALFAYSQASIHPTAVIAPTARLGKNPSIGAYAVIGDGVIVGDDCQIGSHVVIHHHCQIGDEVSIHAHASIGADGFGFAPTQGRWQKIHQLGNVKIGNRVRIGANTCIDRGAMDDTLIGDDVIIDNLVQIAHNVQIGQGSAIAAMTGIAGSTKIGARCLIGGGVGISGHLMIADDVVITGKTFVAQSIDKAGSYSSATIAMPTQEWRRAAIKFRQSAKNKS